MLNNLNHFSEVRLNESLCEMATCPCFPALQQSECWEMLLPKVREKSNKEGKEVLSPALPTNLTPLIFPGSAVCFIALAAPVNSALMY